MFFQNEDVLLTKRFFVPMKTYEAMGNVLNKKELAFVQQKEGEEKSSEGVRAAAFIYVERMFTLNERREKYGRPVTFFYVGFSHRLFGKIHSKKRQRWVGFDPGTPRVRAERFPFELLKLLESRGV